MPAFSEFFVRNAVPPPLPTVPAASSSSSLKNGFGRHRRFNTNVSYICYCCNPRGGGSRCLQQHPVILVDHFAGTFIPLANIWPCSYQQYSTSLKSSFCWQRNTPRCWPADAAFCRVSQVTDNSITQSRLDKRRDASPFSSCISSGSSASGDDADSNSSGIGSQDTYNQQEESSTVPGHATTAFHSSRRPPVQITSLSDDSPVSWNHKTAERAFENFYEYDFSSVGFPQKQQYQSQQFPECSISTTGLHAESSSDISVAFYSASYPSAMELYNQRRRCMTSSTNCSSTVNLRFGVGTEFENAITPATAFRVCQYPNRFLVPLEAIEAYIHCLESFSSQLTQAQITSAEGHVIPEFETATARSTSDFSSRTTNIPGNAAAETLSLCGDVRTSVENAINVSHELGSGTSSISESAVDENDYPTLLTDKSKKLLQDHFLDEDSLLENLPKFEHYNGNCLLYESTRNLNWPQSKSPGSRRDFEFFTTDEFVLRQKKQVLQTKNVHRNNGIPFRGVSEGKSGGLPPLHAYHQFNNWRRHSQSGVLSKNYPTRPFSTSDGFVHSRDRNSYDKAPCMLQNSRRIQLRLSKSSNVRFYVGSMDRSRDRSQCNVSDRRSTSKLSNVYRSANRSSFVSHDKTHNLIYHDGSAENTFNLVQSDDKKTAPDCSMHRNVKRNGSNRSRNSPPVYLALKSHREFVDIDSAEVGTIGDTALKASSAVADDKLVTKNESVVKQERLDRSYSPQQNAESVQKTPEDVEQLTGLFSEHVAVCGGGETKYRDDSLLVISPAIIGVCDRVSTNDQIAERSISPACGITEELPQQGTVRAADARLDCSSEASTPVQEPPEPNIGNSGFELSKLDVLSEEIWYYHKAITQTESVLNRKLHLRDVLYYAISPVFPMCGLYVVGSSLNGFGTNSSDMDLCLMITNKDLDQRTDAVVVLNMIQSALAETKWVSHMQLILAKVPILRIRFYEPFTDITVDLNANNSVAIRNTHLLCYYSSFDWRVRPLVSVVKEWAKRRDINDANRSSFTSYSLVLMVIHYLQCGLKQPILPSLQVVYPKRFSASADVRSLNVSSHLEPPPGWITNETITLGELLIGFLEYYAFKFDYLKDAISVRLGSKTERTVVARQPSPYNSNIAQWNCICIEEPFTLSNTAHSVHNQMVFDAIRQAFVDGCYELDNNRDLKAFLDVGPINVSIGSSVGSNAQLSILAQSDVCSPTTTSSGDVTLTSKHLLTVSPQSDIEYELMEADGPLQLDAGSEMELETAVTVPFNGILSLEQDLSERNLLLNYENGVADKTSGGTTPKSVIEFVENMVPSGAKTETASSILVDDDVSPKSSMPIPKAILSEWQSKQLQVESNNEKAHVNAAALFGVLSQQGSTVEDQQFGGKVQRRRKTGRRAHASTGCAGRNHLNKSNLTQPTVRLSYRSGTASS